ncbi:unnamed protein product, partial [Closterium sp. NIES-64]
MRRVEGIQDVLLIVSHDGYYPKMDAMVRAIDFCPVKQIYFPFSPHLFNGTFPAASPDDCQGRLPRSEVAWGKKKVTKWMVEEEERDRKKGSGLSLLVCPHSLTPLQHHWWWAMNSVWGGVEETRGYGGHVVWVEEDHLLFPNALRHLRALLHAKHARCPHCIAANLAPSDVHEWQDSGPRSFSVETMGNIGRGRLPRRSLGGSRKWNRRPARTPVAAGNAEKSGGGMGLLAKLRAQVRRRARGKRASSITATGSSSDSTVTRSRGPWKKRLSDSDVVMVLLVHNRPAYLRRTLEALSKVEGIQDTLLIV